MEDFRQKRPERDYLTEPDSPAYGNRFEVCQQIADLVDTILIEPYPDEVRPEIADALEDKRCVVTGLFRYYTQKSEHSHHSSSIANLLKVTHSWEPYSHIQEYSMTLDTAYGDSGNGGTLIINHYLLYLPPKSRQTTELIELDATIKQNGPAKTITGEPQKDYPATPAAEVELLEQIEAFALKRNVARLEEVSTFCQYTEDSHVYRRHTTPLRQKLLNFFHG